MTLQIRVAQLNFVVGDMPGNARKIIDFATRAHAEGARLVLTPELSICGYAAEDLFLRPSFIDACDDALKTVARELAGLKGLHVVVGHPEGGGLRTRSVAVTRRHNRASVLCEGQVVCAYDKRELPNYQVFDEHRYFTPGNGVGVFVVAGVRVGLLICEDAWFDEPARLARDAGAQVLAVLNASPFHAGKGPEREQRMRERVTDCGLPLIYAHLVGGQDEVIFEGRSFALNAQGETVARAEGFRVAELSVRAAVGPTGVALTAAAAALVPLASADAELWDALVLGVRDYLGKNGFKGAILGLSGGID
jgi:NAD+ synthase (glutamine-hydrolysing)